MNKKLLLRFSMLAMVAFPAFLFADSGSALTSDQDETNQANRSNPKVSRDEDDEPPPPVGMKLIQPNFSLPGLKPTNTVPTLQMILTSAVLTNSDVADTSLGSSAATSTVFYNGATLSALPKLSEDGNTRLAANINGGFIRYDGEEVNDYDILNANFGIFRQLDDNTTGELGWRYGQFYVNDKIPTNQNLQEQGVRLALNRIDWLPYDFFFQTNYEIQANFSDPVDRSRISHYLSAGLGYYFTNQLQAAVFYRLRHDDFLYRSINDSATRHEFQGQLSYQFNKYINLAGTVSYLFGDTIDLLRNPVNTDGSFNTASTNDLANLSFGLRLNANVPILE
jgi:hypothetical protein